MKGREIVLETRDLSMHFGGVKAVDRVDFSLHENELRCLIGPNGAGKSTLISQIAGFLAPDAGEIRLSGRDLSGLSPARRAGLGLGRGQGGRPRR